MFEYTIKQTGKVLSIESGYKININKRDNKIHKIYFETDGSFQGSLFIALLNPATKKYTIVPLMEDKSFIITSSISKYPGVWALILIASETNNSELDLEVVPDLTKSTMLDYTKITYVSNIFERIVVKDNYLNDNNQDELPPETELAINEALLKLVEYRDKLLQAAIDSKESLEEIQNLRDQVQDFQEQVSNDKKVVEEHAKTASKDSEEIKQIYDKQQNIQIKVSIDAEAARNASQTASTAAQNSLRYLNDILLASMKVDQNVEKNERIAQDVADTKNEVEVFSNLAYVFTQRAEKASENAKISEDNSKISEENAKMYEELAEQHAKESGYVYFDINDAGHLIETMTSNVTDLNFSLQDGRLLLDVYQTD